MPRGFYRLIAAQFVSALADNALLIVALAWLVALDHPIWWAPLLKLCFTVAYVALAPWVGAVADAWPKARVMALMNLVKMAGLLLLMLGVNPLLAFAVAGIGAAFYAPAKYGLVTELVPAPQLVRANGWLEVSVVGAAIFGTAFGGFLVSDLVQQALLSGVAMVGWSGMSATGVAIQLSMGCVLMIYLAASALNWKLPDSGARYAQAPWRPRALLRSFWVANRTLWRDRLGGLSMSVTTLFWGVGATLQIAVIQWSGEALDLSLDEASYLQAVVALGVVAGAAAAGRWIALEGAPRMLWAGVALGALIAMASQVSGVGAAALLLVCCGFVGGLLVVPLNALLQHRGHTLLSAGRSISVQNFNENLSVLSMLGMYSLLLGQGAGVKQLMLLLGVAIAAYMLLLVVRSASGHRVIERTG